MANILIRIPSVANAHWRAPVADSASLPMSGNSVADARVTIDDESIWIWGGDNTWHQVSGGGGGGSDSFVMMQVSRGTSPVATSSTDVLNWEDDGIVTLTGNAGTDTMSLAIAAASITNTQISNSAAIAYSKLNLTGSILNADINASAAIAYSKLATLTASRALVSDGSGFVSVASVTATELGYLSGVSSAIQTQLNGKQATGNYFVNGGNTFGGATSIGTNDNNALAFRVNNVEHWAMQASATEHILQPTTGASSIMQTIIRGQNINTTGFGAYLQLFGGGSTGSATPSQLNIGRAGGNTASDSTYTGGNGFGGSQAAGWVSTGGTGQAATASAGGHHTFNAGPALGTGPNGNFNWVPAGSGTGLKSLFNIGGRVAFTGRQTITSGSSGTVSNDTLKLYFNFAGSPAATYTLTLPADAQLADGQELVVYSGEFGVTTLTMTAGSGSTIRAPLTSCTDGQFGRWDYIKSATAWRRIG